MSRDREYLKNLWRGHDAGTDGGEVGVGEVPERGGRDLALIGQDHTVGQAAGTRLSQPRLMSRFELPALRGPLWCSLLFRH
jgi:hypothetical protein